MRSGDKEGDSLKVSVYQAESPGFKHTARGKQGGVEGELTKNKEVGIWGHEGRIQTAGGRHSESYLWNVESSLTALGVRLGSAHNSCPQKSWESGRDKEEGTIIQLLQPQVPGREQGGGGDDRLLSTRPFGLLGWEAVKGFLSHSMVSKKYPQARLV